VSPTLWKRVRRIKAFLSDLKEWSAISPQLFIWDYVVNFNRYILPYPNFSVLQPNIKTFIENKAIGIMMQGSYQERGGEFQELKAYFIAKLLWNPDLDTDELIDDFIYGYYGRSGHYIRQYFDLLQAQVKPETHFRINLLAVDPVFSDELIPEAINILNKAQNAADNYEVLRRVEVATLPVLFLKSSRSPVAARNDGTFEKFFEILEREGITRIHEYGAGNDLESWKQWVLNAE
jgi:hypothetical protein